MGILNPLYWKGHTSTVYPKKYAHGFCFAVLCCGYTLTDFPISIRLTSLALWQSSDCPSASKATLMNMDKYFMWIHYEQLHNHNKAKHNKTVCIFLGIYCMLKKESDIYVVISDSKSLSELLDINARFQVMSRWVHNIIWINYIYFLYISYFSFQLIPYLFSPFFNILSFLFCRWVIQRWCYVLLTVSNGVKHSQVDWYDSRWHHYSWHCWD